MSTLNVNNINEVGGVDAIVTSGVLDSDSLPAGSILQIVRATDSNESITNSLSFVDVPGMSVTITPTAASSLIIIVASFSSVIGISSASGGDFHRAAYQITNSSNVGISGAENFIVGTGRYDTFSSASFQTAVTLVCQDSPATTSALTYKLRQKSNDNINNDSRVAGHLTTSQIFAIEVAA